MLVINKKVSFGTAVFSAVSLKLCCWGPLLLIGVGGISGGAAYFSWLDTLKPYLLILAFFSLAFGFYQVYKPINKEDCKSCNPKKNVISRSKIYVWLVTIFVILMTLVSYYPQLFYNTQIKSIVVVDKMNIQIKSIKVKGITCISCEENINHTVAKLNGVINVETSQKNGTVKIKFNKTKINVEKIKNAIVSKGYVLNTIDYE